MRVSHLVRSTVLFGTLCASAASTAHAKQPAAPAAQAPPPASPGAVAGGREYGQDDPLATPVAPGAVAQVVDGIAQAPAETPEAVKQVIWAGNQIVGSPYRYGGGHGLAFTDASGYDCSGAISFALHGADLVKRPRDSTGYMRFGLKGPGAWITVFTRSSHAYLTVAGLRLDTSAADDPGGAKGPRWRPLRASDAGFTVRHPVGL